MNHPRAVRIVNVSHSFEDFRYRTPIKFGGVALDRVTILNVTMTVEHADGRRGSTGFGSMPLGNVWSFPSRVLTYDDTRGVMKRIAAEIAPMYRGNKEAGHPIEISMAAEHFIIDRGLQVGEAMGLAEKVPPLCTLVVASAFDAALH